MSQKVRLIVFANSRKPGGRCVAGKVWSNGGCEGWIRPVSARETQELKREERVLDDGNEPALGNIIEIELLRKEMVPEFQPENYLIGPTPWKKVGELSIHEIEKCALDDPDTLWENGHDSKNSRIPEYIVSSRKRQLPSLYLIKTKTLLVDKSSYENDNRNRWYGAFWYKKIKYKLRITDPEFEARLARAEITKLDNPILCISLGDKFVSEYVEKGKEAYHYKLIAGVLYDEKQL